MANSSIKLTDIPLASNISINSKLLAVDFETEKTELITTKDLIVYISNTVTYRDQVNTAYELANSAFVTANAAYEQSLDVFDLSNTAYILANASFDTANAVYELTNSAFIQANNSYNMSNQSFDLANTAEIIVLNNYNSVNNMYEMTNSIALQVNSHYELSNSIALQSDFAANTANYALLTSSSAFENVNNIISIANTAYDKVNVVYAQSNTAYNMSNQAFDLANTAEIIVLNNYNSVNNMYDLSNTVSLQVSSYYDLSNSIFLQSEFSANRSNNALSVANATFDLVNSISLVANTSYEISNAAIAVANLASDTSNNSLVASQAAYNFSNNLYEYANTIAINIDSAYNKANLVYDVANTSYNMANDAYISANSSYDIANSAYSAAINAFDTGNSAFLNSNNSLNFSYYAFNTANSAFDQANNAFEEANSVVGQTEAAFNAANNAYIHANDAYNTANTKLSLSGGTVSGNVSILGSVTIENNLTVSGNVTTISANNLSIQDNMIYLNEGISGNVNPDLGFAGAYNDGTYHHAGFFRDATDGYWKIFDQYEPEPDESIYINTSNSTFRIADFQANNITANTFTSSANIPFVISSTTLIDNLNADLLDGLESSYFISFIETAYNQANTGVVQAQASFDTANTGVVQAQSAFGRANSAYDQANTGVVQAQASFGQANNEPIAKSAYNQANTGVVQAQASFNTANTGVVQAQSAFGRANSAYNQANTANTNAANASFLNTGTVGTSRLASGTANGVTYLRGDQTWSIPGASFITDNSTNESFYFGMTTGLSEIWSTAYISPQRLSFNPGTGNLSSILVNSVTGYKYNGSATSGHYLRGNGTNFVGNAIQAGDVPTLNQNTTGSAATLTTSRTFTIGSTGKTFNGSGNVSWTLNEIGAYANTNPSGYTTNTGTVTSVGGTGTVSGLSLSGTVTTSGNLTLSGTLSVSASNFSSQTANYFLAAPNGTAGVPTFRAIVAADVPTLNQNTTGSSGSCTGNAATATTLQTARTIGGVSFNGSANINLPGVNTAGNQNTTGSSGSCTGNAATATGLLGDESNWASYRTRSVANMLSWKNYGSGHIIFDASNSTAPNGTSVNNTNAASVWSSTYPTLMGWNGSSTYGVRVDSARISDNTSGTASNITAYTINQSVGTGNNVQFNSLGVGTGGSGTAGEIRATNNITAYYSDDRLKTRIGLIDNALEKLLSLDGFYYKANETAQSLGYESIKEVGVSAQQVQKVLPEIVVPAPIDDKYLTVRYEKLIPLLIEAIKEQQNQINELKSKLEK